MTPEFLPWLNDDAINFLKGFLRKSMLVFEYGCGNSTLFFAERVHAVYGAESRQEWVDFVAKNGANFSNIHIKLCENLQRFADEIANCDAPKFDLILIDSRDRAACLLKSIDFISENGIIILDNSERPNLLASKNLMRERGFEEQIFAGTRTDGKYAETSVFHKI